MADERNDSATPGDVICIVGMHRSGTSMIARLLNVCGLDLGPPERLLEPNEANPLGHFEHKGFLALDEALLEALGGAWDDPQELPPGWERDPAFQRFVRDARELIGEFAATPRWGWKEPRTTVLLPFWKALIPRLRFVICVRSPLEVAASLQRRDGMTVETATDLWSRYMRAAIHDSSDSTRLFTFYEDYFVDPSGEVDKLLGFCGLQWPRDRARVDAVIRGDLKHHTSAISRLLLQDEVDTDSKLLYLILRALGSMSTGQALSDDVHRVSELLDRLRDGSEAAGLRHRVARLSAELTTSQETERRLRAELSERQRTLEHLQSERTVLEHERQAILNSRSWKLTAPLRRVFDGVAAARVRLGLVDPATTHGAGRLPAGVPADFPANVRKRDPRPVPAGSPPSFAVYASSCGNYFFGEIRDLLAAGLTELGFVVSTRDEKSGFDDVADWHVVVAPHEFFVLGSARQLWQDVPAELILVNTEQPSTQWFGLAHRCFSLARAVWDINHDTAEFVRRGGVACDYLPLGFVEGFEPFDEVRELPRNYGTCFLEPEITQGGYLQRGLAERPLDVMFVGGLTERRERLLAEAAPVLAKHRCYLRLVDTSRPVIPGLNTEVGTSTVVGLEQRSKIVLNLHRGADRYFEWHRIVMHGIWQRALVISEPCSPAPPFRAGVDYVEAHPKRIAATVESFLSSPNGLQQAQEIAQRGLATLTERCRLADILRGLVAHLAPAVVETPEEVR